MCLSAIVKRVEVLRVEKDLEELRKTLLAKGRGWSRRPGWMVYPPGKNGPSMVIHLTNSDGRSKNACHRETPKCRLRYLTPPGGVGRAPGPRLRGPVTQTHSSPPQRGRMVTTDWHVAITTLGALDETAAETIMAALGTRGPAIALGRTNTTISLTAQGNTAHRAFTGALCALADAGLVLTADELLDQRRTSVVVLRHERQRTGRIIADVLRRVEDIAVHLVGRQRVIELMVELLNVPQVSA